MQFWKNNKIVVRLPELKSAFQHKQIKKGGKKIYALFSAVYAYWLCSVPAITKEAEYRKEIWAYLAKKIFILAPQTKKGGGIH